MTGNTIGREHAGTAKPAVSAIASFSVADVEDAIASGDRSNRRLLRGYAE